MRYLTLIYYDTFARFFATIEDEVKLRDASAEFLHLAIFPSGWLYMKAHGRNVRLLPWQAGKPYSDGIDTDINVLDRIAHYHAVTGARYGSRYLDTLRNRARDYVGTMSRIVDEFRPDVVIFSGDTRIAAESLQHVLNKSSHSVLRYYFEQGPNGTTIFDTCGVNANCSFRESAAQLTGDDFNPEFPVKRGRYRRNPVFRGVDHLLVASLRLIDKVPPEWDTMSLKKIPNAVYLRCIEHGRANFRADSREILVALQVPDDANNIHHNPLGLGDVDLLQWVMDASATLNFPIRVREHPLYRRRYTADMYNLLAISDRALLSADTLDMDLSKAATVITVNSMTGLDAYLRKIPVITLGNAFYDHLPGIERVRNKSVLGTTLADLATNGLASRLDGHDPARIFAEMRARYFISGHYLDAELHAPSTIADILVRASCDTSAGSHTP